MPLCARRCRDVAVWLSLAALFTLIAGVSVPRPAGAIAAPVNPQVVYVVNSTTTEIGLTNAYGTQTTSFGVAVSGPVASPELSPNGAKVAFSADCNLYTVNTDGSGLAALPNPANGACLGNPAWSPDSAQLAFDSNASGSVGLWVANADGTSASEIAPNGNQPSWDPTGTRIVFVATTSQGGENLDTISVRGGPATALASFPPGGGLVGQSFSSPQWSPDGTTIAYVAVSGFHSFIDGAVSLIDADGSRNRQIGGFESGGADPNFVISWCPSGTCLLQQGVSSGGAPVISPTNGGLLSMVAPGGYDASFIGVTGPITSIPVLAPTVGGAGTADGRGVWAAGADGGVFTFGTAAFHGSMGGQPLNKPVVSLAATPDGAGYWEVASDGGIFSFGDARFHGSMGGQALNKPIVGMAADSATGGYWEVASDGGIFSFDAPFLGSMGGQPLNQPIVGMAATPDGGGYWLVAADGGIFAYGNAAFLGSMGGQPLNQPVAGMAAAPGGGGYWEVARDGGVFSFGAATFAGSPASVILATPVVALVSEPSSEGYGEVTAGGGLLDFGLSPS